MSNFSSEYEPAMARVITALPALKNNDAAIARAFDVNRTTPATWRKRNTLPAENLVKLALKFNIDMKWLFTGIGDMFEQIPTYKTSKSFTPALISQAIKDKGYTLSILAEALDVDVSAVTSVVFGHARSRRIAESIAKLLGEPLEVVFPDIAPPREKQVAALKLLLAS